MNLFLPFRRATIERDAALIRRSAKGARCVPDVARIAVGASSTFEHGSTHSCKHPNAPNAGPDPVLGDASATLSAPDALGGNIAA